MFVEVLKYGEGKILNMVVLDKYVRICYAFKQANKIRGPSLLLDRS
jgi:hypothetical protein